MRRVLSYLFVIGLSLFVMLSCEKQNQTENQATTHKLAFSFDNGGSMYKSTKGAASDVFDEFYAKLTTGELVAETYNLTFTEVESGAAYSFSGSWEGATVELQAATYKVTGKSTATGENSQEKCSIFFDETITITNQMTEIVLNAKYDCYLFVMTSEKLDNVDNCFKFLDKYWYAFINGNFVNTLTGIHKDGSKFSVEMSNYSFEKGKYYVYYDVSINEYGVGFLIEKMENGLTSEGDYVDEYGVNYGKGTTINGVTWAPVNCGYKPATAESNGYVYGKLYQWGRKYGQSYCEPYYGDSQYADEGSITLAPQWTGKNEDADKDTFYYGSYAEDSWISNPDMTFWNIGTENTPIKNEKYDPCPKGWRVPTMSELSTLMECDYTDGENDGCIGRWFYEPSDVDNRVFFPHTGARFAGIHSNGAYGRGSFGQYYSSSVQVLFTEGNPIHFDGNVDGYYLGYAHPVRCVADSN